MDRPWAMVRELAIGILINAVVLGFARFSYGMILPFMQQSLGLTYTQAGLLGTVTALGYVGMVMVAGMAATKWGNKIAFTFGILLASISLLSLGFSQHFFVVMLWMLLAGVGTSFTYTPLVSYFMERYSHIRATVTGIISGGWGVGILFVGFAVPWLVAANPENGWRLAWMAFGIIGLLTYGLSLFLPASKCQPLLASSPKKFTEQKKESLLSAIYLNPSVICHGLIYFSIGLSYLIPPTFLLAYMIHAGISPKLAGFWMAMNGFFGIFSGLLWGMLADRFGHRGMFRLSMIFNVVALILPTIWENGGAFLFSCLLLGVTVGGMISLLLANVSQHVPTPYISAALGYVTFYFGIGQLLGPLITGWIIDTWTNGFRFAFWFAALVLSVGYFMTYGIKTYQARISEPSHSLDKI